jgi:excisionase family DNA binding protein
MSDRASIDLRALLADPARVVDVPVTEVPATLARIASEQARLAAVQSALAAHLAESALPSSTTASASVTSAFLTQEEAAVRYRIPLRSMRRLTRAKRIPSTLIGRNRMIRPSDLEDYLARCRKQGVAVGTILDV